MQLFINDSCHALSLPVSPQKNRHGRVLPFLYFLHLNAFRVLQASAFPVKGPKAELKTGYQ
jgi:hypothetical protein